MSEPKKRRNGWAAWVAVGIILPILYVLSSGPMIYLRDHGVVPVAPMNTFYVPLMIAETNCEPFRLIVERYIEFFRVPATRLPTLPPSAPP